MIKLSITDLSIQDFYERYQFLMGPRSTDLPSQVKDFMRGLGFNTEDFQIGMTKVHRTTRVFP